MYMLKNLAQLEVAVEQKIFRFQCDLDAPTHFIKEALFQFQKYVGAVEDAEKERLAKLKAEQDALDESAKESTQQCEDTACQTNLVECNAS